MGLKAVKTPSWTIKFWAIAYVLHPVLLQGLYRYHGRNHISAPKTPISPPKYGRIRSTPTTAASHHIRLQHGLRAIFDVLILTAAFSNNALPLVDLLLMNYPFISLCGRRHGDILENINILNPLRHTALARAIRPKNLKRFGCSLKHISCDLKGYSLSY